MRRIDRGISIRTPAKLVIASRAAIAFMHHRSGRERLRAGFRPLAPPTPQISGRHSKVKRALR